MTVTWHPWLSFTVPGDPVGKGRPRAQRRVRGRGAAAKSFIHIHTDAKTARYEEKVALCAMIARNEAGCGELDGPARVTLRAVLRRPKTAKRLLPHVGKDVDNICKSVMDGCKSLWVDDSRVTDLVASKRYGDPPRVEVEVEVAT